MANGPVDTVRTREISWRALILAADPDYQRLNSTQVEYEFSSPRRGGLRRFYGRTAERGPYGT